MHERGITMGTNIDCREGQTVPTNADNGFTPFFFVFAIPFPAAISSNSIRSTRVDESPIDQMAIEDDTGVDVFSERSCTEIWKREPPENRLAYLEYANGTRENRHC